VLGGVVMKKTALALTLVWLSVNTLLILVHPVQAGHSYTPYSGEPSYIPYPAEPSMEFPTINADSPKNGEILEVTSLWFNFTVTKPDSWDLYWLTAIPVIGTYSAYIYLDQKLLTNSKYPLSDPGSSGFPVADYSVVLSKLSRGDHSVEILVEAATFYNDPSPEPGDYLQYSKNITKTIDFTVNADLPTSSPEITSTPSNEPQSTEIEVILGVAVTVAVLGAGLGLLVYLIKRK
jgi:hypothetical protein